MALARRAEASAPQPPRRSRASQATEKPKDQKKRASNVINLRADEATRTLIDNAANLLGQNRTDFMLTCARVRAQEVLLSQTQFVLSDEAWDAFQADLEAPAVPTPELIALMSRTPLWAK
jgi:uncharacterized protein (DUF1778 family)